MSSFPEPLFSYHHRPILHGAHFLPFAMSLPVPLPAWYHDKNKKQQRVFPSLKLLGRSHPIDQHITRHPAAAPFVPAYGHDSLMLLLRPLIIQCMSVTPHPLQSTVFKCVRMCGVSKCRSLYSTSISKCLAASSSNPSQ
jgi:hypothetical protein